MKSLKMLGLAAVLAMLAMAFAGVSSAMAEKTVLCKSDMGVAQASTECASPITHVHETSVGKAILLANPKVECNVLFLGEVSEGEVGQAVVEGNFTYTSCTSGCTVTEQSASSSLELEGTTHETGKVTGEGEVHVNCIGINCYYNGKGLIGTAKGPLLSTQANGEVSVQEQTVQKTKGTFCPETGKLDITTTPLEATYISGPLLHYCVKYEHNTNGRYEGSCKVEKANGPEDLVIGPVGFNKGDMVCVDMNVTKTGLWEAIKDYKNCEKDSAELSKSLYELGEIILVE